MREVVVKIGRPENPLWYQNLLIISYGSRIIASTSVRGPHCGVW